MANKYKVIALSVGGLYNKIYHSGDIVEASAFPPGNADKLVEKGFLIAEIAEVIAPILEDKKPLSINDFTTKEIKKQLTDAGVVFDKDSTKETLFELFLAL